MNLRLRLFYLRLGSLCYRLWLLNLWFWPFAVGTNTSISYVPGGGLGLNLEHFAVYTLVTSTATWDTVRAITTVIGLIALGPVMLTGLRRVKLGIGAHQRSGLRA